MLTPFLLNPAAGVPVLTVTNLDHTEVLGGFNQIVSNLVHPLNDCPTAGLQRGGRGGQAKRPQLVQRKCILSQETCTCPVQRHTPAKLKQAHLSWMLTEGDSQVQIQKHSYLYREYRPTRHGRGMGSTGPKAAFFL